MPTFPKNPFENLFGEEGSTGKIDNTKKAVPQNPFEGLFEAKEGKTIQTEIPEESEIPKTRLIAAPEKEPKKETLLSKIAKAVLPKGLEEYFGLTEKELTGEELVKQAEAAKQSYWRDKRKVENLAEVEETKEEYTPPETFFGKVEEAAKYNFYLGKDNLIKGYFAPALGTIVEQFGIQANLPEVREWGEKFADQTAYKSTLTKAGQSIQDVPGALEGGLTDPRYYPKVISNAIGFFGAVLGSATLVSIITKSPAAGTATAYAVGAALESSGAYQEMIDKGVNPQDANQAAEIYGIIASFIENATGLKPAGGLRKISMEFAEETAKSGAYKTFLKKWAQEGILEEGSQQLVQNIISKVVNKDQKLTENVAESIIGGVIGALPLVGGAQIYNQYSQKSTTKRETKETPEETEGKSKVVSPQEISAARDILINGKWNVNFDSKYAARLQSQLDDFHEKTSQSIIEIKNKEQNTLASIKVVLYPDGRWGYRFEANTSETGILSDFLSNKLTDTRAKAVTAAKKDLSEYIKNGMKTVSEEARVELQTILDQVKKIEPGLEVPIEVREKEETKKEIPTYAEAQKMIAKEGGYANAKSLPALNRYAADELGITLSLNKKYLYTEATKKGISLNDYLQRVDAATDQKEKIEIGVELMDILSGKKAEATQKEKVAEAVKEKPKTIKEVAEETKILVSEEKGERNLMEIENDDLTLAELKKKLEIAMEGKEDQDLIDQITNDISDRETTKKKPVTRFVKPKSEIKIGNKVYQAHEIAAKLIAKNTVLPVLNEVRVKDGRLLATDLEVSLSLKSGLKDGMYKVVGKEAVKTDTDPAEFPVIPKVEGKPIFKATTNLLLRTLKAAALSVGDISQRSELSGVNMKVDQNQISIASTDSFRLYFKRMIAKILGEGEFILPSVKKINKVIEAIGAIGEVTADKEYVKISGDNGDIVIRKIQADFPNYEDIYPSYSTQYEFDKNQFVSALKELKPFTEKLYNKIEIKFAGGKAILSADNRSEDLHKEIELNVSERKIDIKEKSLNEGVLLMPILSEGILSFNLKYINDAANSIEGDTLYLNLSKDPLARPALITDYKDLESVEETKTGKTKKRPRFAKKPTDDKGVYGFNPKNLEDLKSPAAKKETDKIIKRSEIAKQLSEKLNVPIRRGKFRARGAIGIFKTQQKVVRIKKGGLATIFHEVGHFLDDQFNLSDSLDIKERKALMKEYGYDYAGQAEKQRKEGFAEFLRFRMSGQKEKADMAAPKFSALFDKRMSELPEIKDVIDVATQDYARWKEQPATAKILSTISVGGKEGKGLKILNKLHQLYTDVKDALHPISEFVILAEKVLGHKIPAAINPYILARNLKGWRGKAETFLKKGTFGRKYWEVKDGKTVPVFKGKSFTEIVKPIEDAGKIDDFRVYLVSQRIVKELADRNIVTGISKADAQEALNELSEKNPEFEQAANDLYKYQDDLLDYAIENRLIGKEIGEKIKKLNKFRVPFYRVMEEAQSAFMGGKKIAGNLASPIKKIKGSERDIIDPLESIVKDTYAIIYAVERNNVGIAMANLASQHFELGRLFEEVQSPMKPTTVNVKEILKNAAPEIADLIPQELGEKIVTIFRPTQDRGNNMLNINIGDKQAVFQLDAELFKALQGLNVEDVGMVMRILSMPAKLLRAGATLTPDFSVRNPMRDQYTAFVNSNYGFIPGVDLVKGMFELFKKGDMYDLWRMGGGGQATLVAMDRNYLQKTFAELVKTKGGLFFKYVKDPIELLRAISEIGEQATRLGEASRALNAEANPIEAAYSSREVTLDFSRMGAKAKAINNLIAFWNANLEGLDRMVRNFKERPYQSLFKVFVGITLPSILLYLANRKDPRWEEIPDWQKNLFWIIMTEDHIYRIPKPFELGILFGSIPERIMEYIDTQDKDLFDELLKSVADGASPGYIPTFLEPAIENITNYSFFLGRPIVPQGKTSLPPEAQYGNYTSETAKLIGKVLDYSPSKVDNLIQGYTAGLGKYAVSIIDKTLSVTGITKEEVKPALSKEDYPVLKAFMIRPPIGSSSNSVDRVYDLYAETSGQMSYVKDLVEKGNVTEAKKFFDENPNLIHTTIFSDAINTFSDISDARDAIRASNELSAEQKKEAITKLDTLQTEIAQKVLEQVGIKK